MKQTTTHEFSFFIPDISKNTAGAFYTLHDGTLITRIISVVRLKVGESCVLFDRSIQIHVILQTIAKKSLIFEIIKHTPTLSLKPAITCLLPILKKDDLSDAISSITACGATTIQLVFTNKVQRTWGGSAELERIERVMIAAAEQAKHYAFPIIHEPIPLAAALKKYTNALHIFFDPTGKPLIDIINLIQQKKPSSLCLIVGPEGDLTIEEKNLLHNLNIPFCALTSTVLRAHLALTLATGIIRSL